MSELEFHPLVSIVIPVFNGGNYMREAIDSALAQTYDNVEVLVINDGSSDGGDTDKIARSYGERIRYFVKENGGCASALNVGVSEMKGSYFSWLSHDDRYHPNKISHQIDILQSLDDRQTIIFGGYELIDQRSDIKGSVRPESVLPLNSLDVPLLPLLRGLVHGCTLLISKEHFERVGVFDVNRPSTQDYALWFDMFRTARVRFDSKILIQSRVHPDQGTHRIDKHIDECNALWSGFLRQLTDDEMIAMSGSSCAFFTDTARFLRDTPYKEAAELAAKMADETKRCLKVSVVIPFYNRINWTIEAIQSVLTQTHQNFEVLLIDDGSTEDITPIKQLAGSDSRIHYAHQSNAGPAKARNLGISLATGTYIAFLDADDLFVQNKLERQLTFMLANDARFSHTSYRRMDESGNPSQTYSSGTFSGNVFPNIISTCPIAMPTVMARTDVLQSDRFPEHFEIAEDVCLWIAIASKYEICGLDEALSLVRVGPNTAALNTRKQSIGCVNIAHFVIHDPYFSQFSKQIRSLLHNAANVLDDTSPEQRLVQMMSLQSIARKRKLLRKAIVSLRDNGPKITFQRVRRHIGW